MKNFFVKLSLVVMAFLCALLLVEGGLRLFFPFEVSFDNPKIFWDHWSRSSSEETKNNSRNFNTTAIFDKEIGYILKSVVDQEVNFGKRSGIRIMLLGDSIMHSEEFSQPIISAFKIKYPQVKFDFFNPSTPGWDTAQEAIYLRRQVLKYKPKLVILQFCMNDFSATPVFSQTRSGEFVAFNAGRFGKHFNDGFLLKSELFLRALILYLNLSPLGYEMDIEKVRTAFKNIAALSRQYNFEVNLVLIPYLRPPTEFDIKRIEIVRQLASNIFRKDQISDFLDLQFKSDILKWKKEEVDYTHPNSDFSSRVAEGILKQVSIESLDH